jgi:hypothetical protein
MITDISRALRTQASLASGKSNATWTVRPTRTASVCQEDQVPSSIRERMLRCTLPFTRPPLVSSAEYIFRNAGSNAVVVFFVRDGGLGRLTSTGVKAR